MLRYRTVIPAVVLLFGAAMLLSSGLPVFAIEVTEAIQTFDLIEGECWIPDIQPRYHHWSRVGYTYDAVNDYVEVQWVNYGGRRPDSEFWILENWRHERTEYFTKSGSNWLSIWKIGRSGLRSSGERCATVEYFVIDDNIGFPGDSMVENQLWYTYNGGGEQIDAAAPPHRHFFG